MATEQDAIKVYLPGDDAAALRALAEREGRTLTGLMRMLVREHLEKHEPSGSVQEASLGSQPNGG